MSHPIKEHTVIFSFSSIVLIVMFFLIFCSRCAVRGQVYNYSVINYRDIETNPAIVASVDKNNTINASYQNSFSSLIPFSCSSLNFSKFFNSKFSGLGLIVNNTTIESNTNYAGLSAGYLTTLLNRLFVRIGATYKVINAPAGKIDYYSFVPSGSTNQKHITDNLNASLALSSFSEKYFFSFGLVNIDLPWKTKTTMQFPMYSIVHVGNLMSLLNAANSEISYTAFRKVSPVSKKSSYSQYLDFKFVYYITRKSGIRYGSRMGYLENRYVHCIPFLTWFKRKSAVTLSYNFYPVTKDLSIFPTTIQLNVIYKL